MTRETDENIQSESRFYSTNFPQNAELAGHPQSLSARQQIPGLKSSRKSSMAKSGNLNRRLLSAVLRAPSPRGTSPLSCLQSSPQHWIRAITNPSKKFRRGPAVSFGKENDGLIAPYIGVKKKPQEQKLKRVIITKPEVDEAYEISGFIDRSKPTSQELPSPADDALHEEDYDLDLMSERKSKKRKKDKKTRKERSDEAAEISIETDESEMSRSGRQKVKEKGVSRKPETSTAMRIAADLEMNQNPPSPRPPEKQKTGEKEMWMIQKKSLKEKFKEGWNPRKKLSPDAMQGIRGLHEQDPEKYSTELLAEQFKISPEAIRRILKSKWLSTVSPEKMQERRERWAKRHDRIWDRQAELGIRPPRKKDRQVEGPDKFEQDVERMRILGDMP